jgi:signal peptidase I
MTSVQDSKPLRRRIWKRIREAVPILIVTLAVLSARSSLADHYYVPSGSMLPTVEIGDRIFVDKAAFGIRLPFTPFYVAHFSGPSRGDVVILNSPADGVVLLKRVVAVPGDEVLVRGGRLMINGQAIPIESDGDVLLEGLGKQPHPLKITAGGGRDFGPERVPEDHFLVMGDNRGDSFDGRYFGWVGRSAILGKAEAVYLRSGNICWRAL